MDVNVKKVTLFSILLAILFILPSIRPSSLGSSESMSRFRGDVLPSDDGFAHTNTVYISPGTPSADYSLRLDIDSSFNYSACQADGDDIRFLDNDNATLSFWVEKWTHGGDSTIWIKIPAAGTTSIKMAYGNATIGSGSDGKATFPLFDDFSGATINSTLWDIRNDTYSTASIVSGNAHVQSNANLSVVPYVWMGFADINWTVTYGTDVSNAVMRVSEKLQTENATVYTSTTVEKNQTWILMDYQWINGSLARFYENDTILASHTTNIPDSSLPVSFAARSLHYGPGTNYASFIRSKANFTSGYAVRAKTWFQYDFQYTPTALESIVDIDWVFVRKVTDIESTAWLSGTTDTVAPSISVSGFESSTIAQGDTEYLFWTLLDVHPADYALLLNGQVVRSGLYSSGSQISVQIDSSTLGQLNYTMIANDTFGNVGRLEKLITVVPRTDGGIFLTVGINVINQNGTHNVILTLNMSYCTVLYLNVNVSVVPTSIALPGVLPNGLVIALPVAFNLYIVNSNALRNGVIRVYYDQAYIANQVNENDMVLLRWNAGTSSWVKIAATLSKSQNYIDIPLSENGLYIIASTPKQNYVPIIIIVLICLTGGIVAGVTGYSYMQKKRVKAGGVKSKKSTSTYTSNLSGNSAERPMDASLAKRARIMQVSAPHTEPSPTLKGFSSTEMAATIEPAKKKIGVVNEPEIDIAARAAIAQEMASEVSVERMAARCVVHKGPVSGLSYTCKYCGTVYCMKCAKHLVESGESCWTCKEPISLAEGEEDEIGLPRITVGLFSPEVWQKIRQLDLSAEIFDEVIEYLKGIPPSSRIKYLEETFKDTEKFDQEF